MVLQIRQQVHLRSHQGKTINRENDTRRFRNVEQFTGSVRSIQMAWLILTKTEISVEEIDAQETGLRLIRPGNECLTRLLSLVLTEVLNGF